MNRGGGKSVSPVASRTRGQLTSSGSRRLSLPVVQSPTRQPAYTQHRDADERPEGTGTAEDWRAHFDRPLQKVRPRTPITYDEQPYESPPEVEETESEDSADAEEGEGGMLPSIQHTWMSPLKQKYSNASSSLAGRRGSLRTEMDRVNQLNMVARVHKIKEQTEMNLRQGRTRNKKKIKGGLDPDRWLKPKPDKWRHFYTDDSSFLSNCLYPLLPLHLYFTFCLPKEKPGLGRINDALKGHGDSDWYNRSDLICFSICRIPEEYEALEQDFGPVSLAVVIKFCDFMRPVEEGVGERWVFRALDKVSGGTNAAFLLGAYCMLEYGFSPQKAARAFELIKSPNIQPFRCASRRTSDFGITVRDVLEGLHRAMSLGWFSQQTFDLLEYERLRDLHLHEISTKFSLFPIPFSNPLNTTKDSFRTHCEHHFLKFASQRGVQAIFRLHESKEGSKIQVLGDLVKSGSVKYHDIFMNSGDLPSDAMAQKFLRICDSMDGMITIQCSKPVGIGLATTFVGLHLIARDGFTAQQAIGWLRLVRPWSVQGQQQQYLFEACVSQRFHDWKAAAKAGLNADVCQSKRGAA